MFISCLLSSVFLNFLLKFDAMWHMQNTNCSSYAFQLTSANCNVDSLVVPLPVMSQTFGIIEITIYWLPLFLIQQLQKPIEICYGFRLEKLQSTKFHDIFQLKMFHQLGWWVAIIKSVNVRFEIPKGLKSQKTRYNM